MALLKKMQMPKGRKQEMDLSDLADVSKHLEEKDPMDDQVDEEMEDESAAEEAAESPEDEANELDHVPDDALLAEIKKRGLMADLEKDEKEDAEDQDVYS